MKIHNLKIKEQHYVALFDGSKKAEIRFDDRNYQLHDLLFFGTIVKKSKEMGIKPYEKIYLWLITHIVKDEKYLQPGYAMLSLVPVTVDSSGNPIMVHGAKIANLIYDNIDILKSFVKTIEWKSMSEML